MEKPQLSLSLGGDSWHYFALRASDPNFEKFAIRVFERDGHTCVFCGFRAFEHMKVVNQNGNYLDNRFENLVTACPLCAQCLFLEMVGRDDSSGGQLILMDEISQNDLNGLCHAIFCAVVMSSSAKHKAQSLYDVLKLRAQLLERTYGAGLSDPAFMGQMIMDTPSAKQNPQIERLKSSLRLLPSLDAFSTVLRSWMLSGAMRNLD